MKIFVFLIPIVSLYLFPMSIDATVYDYHFNQLGFYPSNNKLAYVANTADSKFELINCNGDVVYTGPLSKTTIINRTKDSIKIADFSTYTTEGIYQIRTNNKGLSTPFRISSNVLSHVAHGALKSFYYQRCSMKIDPLYGGIFARAAGHPDTACYYHPSTNKDTATPPARSPGGWYDAGDYGKYIVNAGITVGTLLNFYELFPKYFNDSTQIPESYNEISDLLDEVKYELDWMKTMQDSDGGVFHKLTSLNFCGFVMPANDKLRRYFIGKSTAATYDFAAVMAMAGRIYASVDSSYATDCINRAEKAWEWATLHPSEIFANPDNVGTGDYADASLLDESIWATTELSITTGKSIYTSDSKIAKITYSIAPSWNNVRSLAALSAIANGAHFDSSKIEQTRQSIITQANSVFTKIDTSTTHFPAFGFSWGSNSVVATNGVLLLQAYLITKEEKYLKAATLCADYLLGMNPTGYSFFTGYGAITPMFPHHRPSSADGVSEPVPGLLVGGPSGSATDYLDDESSYETNEVAINWNAPAVFLMAAIDNILNQEKSIDTNKFILSTICKGNGKITVVPNQIAFEKGTIVTITAQPDSNYSLLKWSRAASGTTNPITLTITNDTRIEAHFNTTGELILNGNFASGLDKWTQLSNQGGVGTGTIEDGVYRINITNGGTQNWSIQLVQNNLELINNGVYELSFDSWSDSTRTLVADIAMSSSPYSSYMGSTKNLVSLTKDVQHFTLTFTMASPSDSKARITINAGGSNADVYIDNVSLKLVDQIDVKQKQRSINIDKNFYVTSKGSVVVCNLVIAEPANSSLKIFDLRGKLISDFSNALHHFKSGQNRIQLMKNLVPGMYCIHFNDGKKVTNKVISCLKK